MASILNGENAASAGGLQRLPGRRGTARRFLPQIVQNPDGSVDVNGDGKSNGVFMGSQNIGLYDITTQRKRKAANASFQMDLGHGFTLTSDFFYAHQDQYDRNVGIQFNSTNWQGATYVPLQSRDTGSTALGQYNTPHARRRGWAGSHIYTTQVYEKWPGDVESFSQVTRTESTAQNFNVQLDFDNGGPFTGSVRGIRETAQPVVHRDRHQHFRFRRLPVGRPRQRVPCGTFVYPDRAGRQSRIQRQRHSAEYGSDHRGFQRPQSHDRHACLARQPFRRPQRLDDEDAGIHRRLRPQDRASPRCASMDTTTSTTASTSISACATASAAPIMTASLWSPRCTPAWAPATRTDAWCVMSAPM